MNDDINAEDDPKCAECKLSIEEGSVVAFGNHIWHVECFRCAKCHSLVDHDSNLLLLSNGKPICENCSYNCRVCDKKIDDLAIMTGDDSYHSECFRCRLCQRKIEDLVFAKTSQGIYCIACHNGRMSKTRRPQRTSSAQKSVPTLSKDQKDKTLPSVPARNADNGAHTITSSEASFESQLPGPAPLHSPVPTRKPPEPPLNGSPSNAKGARLSREVEEFDFNLSQPSQPEKSFTIPLGLDESSPRKSFTNEINYSNRTQKRHSRETSTSTNVSQEGRPSLRDRRRPTDTELRLPKTQQELVDAIARDKLLGDSRTTSSLAPPGSVTMDRVNGSRSPAAQLFIAQNNNTQAAMDLAPVKHSVMGDLEQTAQYTTHADHQNPQLTSSKSPARPNPSTPTKSVQSVPAVPPRSADRLVGNRQEKKPLNSETSAFSDSQNSQGDLDLPDVQISSEKQLSDAQPQSFTIRPTPEDPARLSDGRHTKTTSSSQKSLPPRTPELKSPRLDSEVSSDTPRSTESSRVEGLGLTQPTTPIISHKRNFSGPGSPYTNIAMFHAADMTENSPFGHLPSGNSVTNFENDISKAFNLSPPTKSSNTQSGGLERSGTISRLATKMLKHRKSVSGSSMGHKSPNPSLSRVPAVETPMEVVALQQEVVVKRNRISQLEEIVKTSQITGFVEQEMETNKARLASIETKIVESGAELQSYLHHRHRISDTKIPLGEWKTHVVNDMEARLQKAKDDLTQEIESLIQRKNELKLQNEDLIAQKSAHIQELAIMEKRRETLSTMNQSMLKQIQDDMLANRDTRLTTRPRTASSTDRNSETSPSLIASIDPSNQTFDETASDADTAYAKPQSVPSESQDDLNSESVLTSTAVKRLSGERMPEVASPKKFNLVKKTKKALRWGRGPQPTDTLATPYVIGPPLSDKMMTGSRSSDKLSSKSNNMFKRTWQSQQSLSSHLENPGYHNTQSTVASLFGTDLVVQTESEGRLIPHIVTTCITTIEARALTFEGLYRKSGGAGEMKLLIEAFEQANRTGDTVDFEDFNDISSITSVLKQYLRKLPNPLISYDSYEAFLGTAAIPDDEIRVRAVKDVLRDLPQAHYHTIRAVFAHLHIVSLSSASNLMTSKNLAVVLGPSVIWDQVGDKEISDMHLKTSCIQFCIDHAQDF